MRRTYFDVLHKGTHFSGNRVTGDVDFGGSALVWFPRLPGACHDVQCAIGRGRTMPDDLQRDLSQKSRLQTLSILVFIVAIVTIAAMTYVQTVLVPGFVEIAVRTWASLGGLIAVPLFLTLGFRDWLITSRAKLPA